MYSIIKRRTEAKDLRMSGNLVLSKEEWLERGGHFIGTLGQAAQGRFFTARACEKIGQPVSDIEFAKANDFAIMASCYQDNCLQRNGKSVRPCIPVFYRAKNVSTNCHDKMSVQNVMTHKKMGEL